MLQTTLAVSKTRNHLHKVRIICSKYCIVAAVKNHKLLLLYSYRDNGHNLSQFWYNFAITDIVDPLQSTITVFTKQTHLYKIRIICFSMRKK